MNKDRNKYQHQKNFRPSIKDKWENYLKGGYFDDKNCLKTDYVSFEKMKPMAEKMELAKLSKSQIRRFFSHCRAIEIELKGGADWDCVKSKVLRLRFVAAHSKQANNIPDIFHEFISLNVDEIKSKNDFLKGFLPHFEALVGFSQLR